MENKSITDINNVPTVITSNGSKWAGQEPDTLETLIEVLGKYDLDIARFGAHGFVEFTKDNGYASRDYENHTVRLFGNFLTISHAFNIEGLYRNLRPVIEAIDANLGRIAARASKVQG